MIRSCRAIEIENIKKHRYMQLTLLSVKQFSKKLKATIHSTGRFGFTDTTAKELRLTKDSGIKFLTDENNQLYIINCHECDEDAFPVLCSKDYFSVNTKVLFDNLGYDYVHRKYIFDMVRVKEETDCELYRLILRDNRKAKTSETTGN